jgi:hypothetical protein
MASCPESLNVLVDQFDASVFDASQDRARIRLPVEGDGQDDVLGRAAVDAEGSAPQELVP